MPKAVAKKNKGATAASLPYGNAAGAAKTKKKSSSSSLSSSSKSKHASTATKTKSSTNTKKPPSKQSSFMSFAWGKKNISDWKVDDPINAMVLCMSNDGACTPINIHELKERRAAASSMEDQAAVLAKSGDYTRAEQMQSYAEQLKERISPDIKRYYDVLEAAKKAAFAKNYWFEKKKFMLMGQWDKILTEAQHLAMLDGNNNPIQSVAPPLDCNNVRTQLIAPMQQREGRPPLAAAADAAIDLVTNASMQQQEGRPRAAAADATIDLLDSDEDEDAAAEEGASETAEDLKDDDDDIVMVAADGTEKPLKDVFDAPKVHKQGKASDRKRKGAFAGKTLDESKQGTRQKKDKKNPDVVTLEMFNARLKEPVNRSGVELENKLEEGLVFKDKRIYCNCCDGREVAYATMNQHVTGKGHQKKKIKHAKKEARKKLLMGRVDGYAMDEKITGQSGATELKVYHVEALEEMCTANASACTFQNMTPFIDGHSGEGKHVGNVQDLVERWGPFLLEDLIKRNQQMVSDDACFPEFATTSDGSPLIGNAEGVRITRVRKDTGEIVSPLVSFNLYDESLNGKKHANHLIKAIKSDINGAGLDPSDWQLKYKGKLRDHFRGIFHEAPIKSGGNRWWTDWEQSKQISDFGIHHIINSVFEWGPNNSASEQSCKTLLSLFSVEEDGGKERLAHAIIENAAVCDVGYLYVIYTYILEGKDPLILSAYRAFEKLDAAAGANIVGQHDFPVPTVEKIADEAISLLNNAREPISSAAGAADALLAAAESELKAKKDALADLVGSRSRVGQGDRRSSREVVRATFTQGGQIASNMQELKKRAEEAVKEQKKVVSKAKTEQKEKADALSEWNDAYSHLLTRAGVVEYSRECTKKGHEKYIEQFHGANGRCTEFRQCAYTMRLADPFELKRLDVTSLELLADGLVHFKSADGERWFSDEFIAGIKSEIPKAKEHAAKEYDWDNVPDSNLYKNRMLSRRLKKNMAEAAARARGEVETHVVDNDGNDITGLIAEQSDVLGERSALPTPRTWKDDLGEYARRIYLWWLPRWLHTNEFHFFGIFIRKAVLKKASSADIERDFSKYLAITRAVGTTQIKKPMLHNRVFCRCNKEDYIRMKVKETDDE
eukprot:scaffold2192_cov98-Skeletonema_dohrnii-CCMP3373.AAC.1